MHSKIYKAVGSDGGAHTDIPVAEVVTLHGQITEVPTNTDWINFNVHWPKVLLLGDSLTQVLKTTSEYIFGLVYDRNIYSWINLILMD